MAPVLSVTVTVLYVPAVVGVPVIAPVELLIDRAGGQPGRGVAQRAGVCAAGRDLQAHRGADGGGTGARVATVTPLDCGVTWLPTLMPAKAFATPGVLGGAGAVQGGGRVQGGGAGARVVGAGRHVRRQRLDPDCRAAARPMPATATPSEVVLLYVTPLMTLVPLPSESR